MGNSFREVQEVGKRKYLGILESKHIEDTDESIGGVSYGCIKYGHGAAGLGAGRAYRRCVLTGHFGLVVHGIVGIGAERAGHTQPLEAVGSANDRRHCPAVKCFGQRVSRSTRLQ